MLLEHETHRPSLQATIACSIGAATCWTIQQQPAIPIWLQTLAMLSSWTLFGAAFALVAERVLLMLVLAREAASQTEKVLLARSLQQMDKQQIDAFLLLCGITENAATLAPGLLDGYEPVPRPNHLQGAEIDGTWIPYRWLSRYLRQAKGNYLAPLRNFSSGSVDRVYAETVTNWMVRIGLAEPAYSNRPARVRDWQAVAKSLPWTSKHDI